ncbi:MAG: hypothetical protein A2831_01570 [Candidatus Yanofskybacteria bacterium RIFCSPHIGHO2_01_FULL_44_17]|uniref:DUF58 domain-containing protein n=1 Tax=Candidatus Yanofskybacteria bacterium RIFCSPHIGHO2_01_FULL_44_17 TaxID=1802668 RepID=A0A1F8EX16_9BACT|nr:MAG: hypothetical protein A2831_01570 [Candidatus Yanofskybacteria bacterium RIFCSPHIGHO2_01_FULL_44_17]
MIEEKLRLAIAKRISGLLSGEYSSWQMNPRGHDLEEKRKFRLGDDPRSVDLLATAKRDDSDPRVSVHRVEKAANIVFLLDASRSIRFGTVLLKYAYLIEFTRQLTSACSGEGNRFRFVAFDDGIRYDSGFIASQAIAEDQLQELLKLPARACTTNLSAALTGLSHGNGQSGLDTPGIVFIISDFLFENSFRLQLNQLSERVDVIALFVRDPAEIELPRPKFGFVRLVDPETGKKFIARKAANLIDRLAPILRRSGIDWLELNTGHEIGEAFKNLAELFEKRKEQP